MKTYSLIIFFLKIKSRKLSKVYLFDEDKIEGITVKTCGHPANLSFMTSVYVINFILMPIPIQTSNHLLHEPWKVVGNQPRRKEIENNVKINEGGANLHLPKSSQSNHAYIN